MTLHEGSLHAELQEQLRFERLITELSSRFVNLPPQEVDKEIESGMRHICETLGLERCSLAQYDDKTAKFVVTHRWALPGIALLPDLTPHEQIPWIAQCMRNGEYFQFSNVDDYPEEAEIDKKTTIELVKSRSGCILPLSAGGKVIGAIAYDTMTFERVWSAQITERLMLVAQVFANALSRKLATEDLYLSQEKLRLAMASSQSEAWEWQFDREEIWGWEQNHHLSGLKPGEKLTIESFLHSVHPEDRPYVSGFVNKVQEEAVEFAIEYRLIHPDGDVRWLITRGRSYANGNGKPDRVTGVTQDITDRKRVEFELSERARLGKFLSELSATFINLKTDQLPAEIESAQRLLCEKLSFDLCILFGFVRGTHELHMTQAWPASRLKPGECFTPKELPWTIQELLAERSVQFRKIADLPKQALDDKTTLERHELKSCLILPVAAAGEVLGALLFGLSDEERDCPEFILDALQLVSQVFANAIARARYDEKLHYAYSEIRSLKDRLERENRYLREEIKVEYHHHDVIGKSEGIRGVLKSVAQVAPTDSTVMLQGETGTGKELIARAIHDMSRRKDRPMIKVNCAALPATLVESELFGREKGAYTGALTREPGRFEVANGSTLFLDEIGELPLELQAKLLRVLQEGEFERLGSSKTVKVDVRVIVATARDLKAMVKERRFREDLFYRISVFPLHIPPLRERKEDIPMLVWHFVREIGRRMGRNIEDISASTMRSLQNYSWPGNVRELRNVIERHLITTTGPVLEADLSGLESSSTETRRTLEAIEIEHIAKVLKSAGGRIRGTGGAAEILGMKPSTLESRMKKLGVVRKA